MSIIIETNDEKELSGNANGVYFVVYKDKLNSLTPSDTLALVQAADEIATLRAQLVEAQKAVNEAVDIFQFVANEDMQIMENGYQAEEMAGHWISKYSKLVTTA